MRYLTTRNIVLGIVVIVLLTVILSNVGCSSAAPEQTKNEQGHVESQPESNEGEGTIYITPKEGTVIIQTIYGEIKKVVRPAGGGIFVNPFTTFGDEYYTVSTKPATDDYVVRASAQNAPFKLTVRLTVKVTDTDTAIEAYVREFGLDATGRHTQRKSRIDGALNTSLNAVINNLIASTADIPEQQINDKGEVVPVPVKLDESGKPRVKYDAYSLISAVPKIQSDLVASIKPTLEKMHMELVTLEIIGVPDYDDDAIDNAASAVVAAQKKKEGETALLEAERIANQRRSLEAQAYANPQYREIELMKLRVQEAEAWSHHNGSLVFGAMPQGTRFDVK